MTRLFRWEHVFLMCLLGAWGAGSFYSTKTSDRVLRGKDPHRVGLRLYEPLRADLVGVERVVLLMDREKGRSKLKDRGRPYRAQYAFAPTIVDKALTPAAVEKQARKSGAYHVVWDPVYDIDLEEVRDRLQAVARERGMLFEAREAGNGLVLLSLRKPESRSGY